MNGIKKGRDPCCFQLQKMIGNALLQWISKGHSDAEALLHWSPATIYCNKLRVYVTSYNIVHGMIVTTIHMADKRGDTNTKGGWGWPSFIYIKARENLIRF